MLLKLGQVLQIWPNDYNNINPNLGGLFRGSFWGREGGLNYLYCLRLVRIMLETSNLARKYKPICSFRKYSF